MRAVALARQLPDDVAEQVARAMRDIGEDPGGGGAGAAWARRAAWRQDIDQLTAELELALARAVIEHRCRRDLGPNAPSVPEIFDTYADACEAGDPRAAAILAMAGPAAVWFPVLGPVRVAPPRELEDARAMLERWVREDLAAGVSTARMLWKRYLDLHVLELAREQVAKQPRITASQATPWDYKFERDAIDIG